jgi:CotS family spore coat protein
MEEPLLYTCSADIDDEEMELLEKILENYDINYKSVEKVRSAYKISTEDKIYCLKMLGKGYKRADKSFFLSNALREKGFDNVARYIFTKDGKHLVKNKKSSFYLTEWIESREVDFKSIDDILDCARFLADFHNTAKDLVIPENLRFRNNHNRWKETFLDHIATVEKIAQKLETKSKKTGFDLIYQNNLHIFRGEAGFALQLLETEEAKSAFKAAEEESCICHDSFYYQNILRDLNGKLYLVDLESSQLDCPMSDLGKFMRRILCKGIFKWDFDLCRQIIDAYNEVRPISQTELYPLLSIMAFPHKFWKFGKKRYIKKKDWTEEEYQNKLKKVINMQKYKIEFVRNFMMFYNIS